VLDVVAAPATLLNEKKNYRALDVAKDLGLVYRELQEFSGAVILREVRGVE
jgi:hypothetical protein